MMLRKRSARLQSLLDLPDELLTKCLPQDEEDLQPCLAVCHRLLDLLLKDHTRDHQPRLRLLVDKPEDVCSRRVTLWRAAHHFPGLTKLRLKACKELPVEQQLADLFTGPSQCVIGPPDSPEACDPGTAGPAAAWLPGIKDLELYGCDEWPKVKVQQLVPECLAKACPHITHLHLECLDIQPPKTHAHQGVAHLPQLHDFSLDQCVLSLQPTTFAQQLKGLPNVSHLTISSTFCGESQEPQREVPYATAVADALSARLTTLVLDLFEWSPAATAALLRHSWPRLLKLCLPRATLGDTALELLLQQMPRLQHLQVWGFSVKRDFHARPCRWRHVVMGQVDVASLACLPLHHLTSLQFVGLKLQLADTGSVYDDLQLTAAAVVAVSRCGGLQPSPHYEAIIQIPPDAPPHMSQVLQATLPLLQHVPTLNLLGVHVTPQLLAAISAAMPACTCLAFNVGCTFEPGIWGSMVGLLPYVGELHINADAATLQQLAILCTTASHPLALAVHRDEDTEEEVQEQLLSVVRDMGPKCLVTLLRE